MTKTFILLLLASTLSAQSVFQKKMEGIELAEGLALTPDGGYILAGLRSNCIQLLRFDAAGAPLWMRQICPGDPNADVNISALQLVADVQVPGAFLLVFRKGAFSSAPDNLLNVMKFDAAGGLQWECQLRPDRRFGPFTPGNQLSTTPEGNTWAVHAMGLTSQLPYFNQALIFKVNALGQTQFRRFYKTDEPAIANGIAAKNDQEVFVYGTLGFATNDGYLMKINESGDTIWSKRYAGLQFLRDGGFFPNGDLLLMAEYENRYALARIAPNGSMVWARKCPDTLNLFHCAVSADGGVVVAGRNPNGLSMLFKISANPDLTIWAKSYEECTRYQTTALRCPADGGFVCAQNSTIGLPQTRFFKGDELGRLSPECPVAEQPPPLLKEIAITVYPLQFTYSDGQIQPPVFFLKVTETAIAIKNCCPTEYPNARFELPDSVCANAPFSLISTGNPCADEWEWQMAGAMPQVAQGAEFQDIVVGVKGDFPVSLTEHVGFCSDTFSDTLHVVDLPNVEMFGYSDTTLCPDAPLVIQPDLADYDRWNWDDGSTAPAQVLDPPIAGTVRLFAYKGECAVADSITIKIGHCEPARVYVPNAFSPDEDGQNDFWEIYVQYGVSALECSVFDRWGNLCYASGAGEVPRWDGRVKGRPCAAGVYVWQFRLRNAEGKEAFLSGDLLLVH